MVYVFYTSVEFCKLCIFIVTLCYVNFKYSYCYVLVCSSVFLILFHCVVLCLCVNVYSLCVNVYSLCVNVYSLCVKVYSLCKCVLFVCKCVQFVRKCVQFV
jgi:hypothetical protein